LIFSYVLFGSFGKVKTPDREGLEKEKVLMVSVIWALAKGKVRKNRIIGRAIRMWFTGMATVLILKIKPNRSRKFPERQFI